MAIVALGLGLPEDGTIVAFGLGIGQVVGTTPPGDGGEDHDQIPPRGAGRRHSRVPPRSRQLIRVMPDPIEVRVEITVAATVRVEFGDDEAMMLLY